MKATKTPTGTVIDVNKEEFVTLLRPGSMLTSIAASGVPVQTYMRANAGRIDIPDEQICPILAIDPTHEIDRTLKKVLALHRHVIA